MSTSTLTCQELRKLLHYDAKRGIWRWRVSWQRVIKGDIAGSPNGHGYRNIKINGKKYIASRLAFLYIRGYFPENQVDHINRNRADDRWCNLREVSRQCNVRNCGNNCANTSGVKGVCWYKRYKKWRVQISVNKKIYSLGYFKDFTEAVACRLAAEQCLGWEGCDSSSPAYQHIKKYLAKKAKKENNLG